MVWSVTAETTGSYAAWSLDLPEASRRFTADADGDSHPNGLEFSLGLSALVPQAGLNMALDKVVLGSGLHPTVSFAAAEAAFEEVTLRLEGSDDAVTWVPVVTLVPGAGWQGDGEVTMDPVPGGGPVRVRVTVRDGRDLAPGRARFYRLSAVIDEDGDGMRDVYEIAHGLNPRVDDAALDLDGDGLDNATEHRLATRADRRDSDGDGRLDGFEVAKGRNPSLAEQRADLSVLRFAVYLPLRRES